MERTRARETREYEGERSETREEGRRGGKRDKRGEEEVNDRVGREERTHSHIVWLTFTLRADIESVFSLYINQYNSLVK